MKRFLTKEEAHQLKEALAERYKYMPETKQERDSGLKSVFVFPIDVENLIDEHTEKEFPRFKTVWCDINISRDYDDLIVFNTVGSVCFEDFKEFVKGMNEIAKWLEENE